MTAALVAFGLSAVSLAADDLLKANHPDRYVVQKGDTLWDIAGRFLNKPWLWPEIWHANPKIANPHLIYPGDELELVYVDGKPRLQVKSGVVKLSPEVRSSPWDGAVPTIPVDVIGPFLSRPYVLAEGVADDAPYVVDFVDEHIAAGAGQGIYARRIPAQGPNEYDVVRPGDAYRDGDTGEILGYEALYMGTANVTRRGDPATLAVRVAQLEILGGDRLVPSETKDVFTDFQPHSPIVDVHGSIIGVLNGVSQIGQFNVVVLDRGTHDGLDAGTVLQVDNRGEVINDKYAKDDWHFSNTSPPQAMIDIRGPEVTLPDEQAGYLMVFRTFERVSFGLVMDAVRAIHVGDRIHNP